VSTTVALRALSKTYPGAAEPTVDAVDLAVPAGALVALLGPSGCGKTTTLKMLAGLLAPTSGDVTFDGRSVLGLPAERRPVAMVFQKPLLFPHLSIGDNVGFGLRMRGVPAGQRRERVAQMLELVRLPGLESRRVGELSGGQEQRVSLARALVVEPAVLLLDEPLSQLDAALRVQMRELVRRVQREVGVTTLFVTHDQEEAVVLADRIALMLDGRIEQYDEPAAFYERPATLAAARFFGATNTFPGTVRDRQWSGPLGEFAVDAPDGPGVLVLRQEALMLCPAGQGEVAATVRAVTYLGTATGVELDVRGLGVEVSVSPFLRPAVGDAVGLGIPAAARHVVRP